MSAIRLVCLLLAAVIPAGCGVHVPSPSETDSPTPTPSAMPPCGHVSMNADWGPYVIAGITEEGTLHGYPLQANAPDAVVGATIVVGRVLGFDAGIADPPDWRVFTPVRVGVQTVIQGDIEQDGFRFLVEGGEAGCLTERVDTTPTLLDGARYVFFLYPPTTSEGVVHADRLVLRRDAWYVDDRDMVGTPAGPMPLADLVERIGRIVAASSPAPART